MLQGIIVLDLSSVGPGSRCSWLLADLGAEVVKVVAPASRGRIDPPAHSYGAGRGTRQKHIPDIGAGQQKEQPGTRKKQTERLHEILTSTAGTFQVRLRVEPPRREARARWGGRGHSCFDVIQFLLQSVDGCA